MRIGRTLGWMLVAALMLTCIDAASAKDEKKKSPELSKKELKVLKERFKKRHSVLGKLKRAGTIGETHTR